MSGVAMLQEMGIPVWQLRAPDRINTQAQINIPQECQLLLIAPQYPPQNDIELIEKITKSMDVQLNHVFYLSLQQLQLISQTQSVEWIWFCGEEKCSHSVICNKQVCSHSLKALQENALFKKQLWQQIKQFKGA